MYIYVDKEEIDFVRLHRATRRLLLHAVDALSI